MIKRVSMAVLVALLGSASVHATDRILVASIRSNSIEEFNTSGTWLRTFATTGPYSPVALAQSPLSGDIFATTIYGTGPQVGQLTNKILRYRQGGRFIVDWDTFTVECPPSPALCFSPSTQSLLFDTSGNLWVALAYGDTVHGYPIYIFEYPPAELAKATPSPSQTITVTLNRGNQMAFNVAGDLCIASWADQDVQCLNTLSHLLTHDYHSKIIAGPVGTIQPIGLAFDGNNILYLTSWFEGQIVKETTPGGSFQLLANVTSAPNELQGNLVLKGGSLFTTNFSATPASFSTPDPVYQISSGGAVTKLINGTAAPGLGDDHIWSASWMIFYCFDCVFGA